MRARSPLTRCSGRIVASLPRPIHSRQLLVVGNRVYIRLTGAQTAGYHATPGQCDEKALPGVRPPNLWMRREAEMSDHRPPSGRKRDDRGRDARRSKRHERAEGRGSVGDVRATAQVSDVPFTCGHCGRRVGPLPSGGRNRNHCPYCLFSRHVDAERSGERASDPDAPERRALQV